MGLEGQDVGLEGYISCTVYIDEPNSYNSVPLGTFKDEMIFTIGKNSGNYGGLTPNNAYGMIKIASYVLNPVDEEKFNVVILNN